MPNSRIAYSVFAVSKTHLTRTHNARHNVCLRRPQGWLLSTCIHSCLPYFLRRCPWRYVNPQGKPLKTRYVPEFCFRRSTNHTLGFEVAKGKGEGPNFGNYNLVPQSSNASVRRRRRRSCYCPAPFAVNIRRSPDFIGLAGSALLFGLRPMTKRLAKSQECVCRCPVRGVSRKRGLPRYNAPR